MTALRVNTVGTIGGGTADRLLVLIHGYGADEYDLAPLTEYVDPDGRFHTVCPRGPYDVMGAGAGWYERDADGNIDPDMFVASVAAIDSTIDEICTDGGYDRSQAVFIGFSQGGAMTLASTLRAEGATRPCAMACLSGMLQEIEGVRYDFDAAADLLPAILVHHGTLDPMVKIDRGHKTRDTLASHGIDHVYREYPMGHEINPQSLFDLRDWLAER